ncbi:MAG: tetratricopeptide repeat protein [Sphingomonas taxi]
MTGMMMRRVALLALMGSASWAAQAADKVLYQPVPAWVKPAPAIDPATITPDSPVLLLLDNQQRLEGGEVWQYTDTATRIASAEMLGQAGTVTLQWQPAAGDLIVHRAEIIRGAERIDLLKTAAGGGKGGFDVLRREQQLEQRQLDGMLTATMAVEGLRVGDVLHVVASITRKDAVLKGQVQGFLPLPAAPLKIGYARARLLWPAADKVQWKMYVDAARPAETNAAGYREISLPLPLAKQPDLPTDVPARFRKLNVLEATSFTDWAGVSAVMAPLYATDGLIAADSPLGAELARIKAASTDPMQRTAMALQLVQEQVRYLFNGMDQGNYRPQSPAQTWQLRYGDCKAKTLMLLALLHGLDIEAEPVLANSKLGDLLPDRLPTPGAFDHILVKANVAGQTLWLDGTDAGARLADLGDTPPFRWVLPVRASGATLIAVPVRPHARPDIEAAIDLDERAGVGLPAPVTATITLRGRVAQMLQAAQAQASKDDLRTMANKMTDGLVGSATVVDRKLAYDPVTGTASVTVTGVAYPDWNRVDQRYRSVIDRVMADMKFEPDRSRTAWATLPVSTGDNAYYRAVTRIRLPDGGKGYTLDGDQSFARPMAGMTLTRTVKNEGGVVTLDDRSVALGTEIPATEIAANRAAIAAAKNRLLSIVAPADLPSFHARVEAARRAGGFQGIAALYDRGIADQPEEAASYTNRAWFMEQIYDRPKAIADIGRAIAIKPDVDSYTWRARLYRQAGEMDKALADLTAALAIDASSNDTIEQLAQLRADRGEKDKALELIQERIDAGGKSKAAMIALKADVLARTGDKDGALVAIDQAVAASPGNPQLLNSRCWIKGTLNVQLDTALKDCTRSIELSDSTLAALDSRAMVFFRMNRMDDALADLGAALDTAPDQAASLYLRGVILSHQGKPEGKTDLIAARTIRPRIDDDYKRYGIVP